MDNYNKSIIKKITCLFYLIILKKINIIDDRLTVRCKRFVGLHSCLLYAALQPSKSIFLVIRKRQQTLWTIILNIICERQAGV